MNNQHIRKQKISDAELNYGSLSLDHNETMKEIGELGLEIWKRQVPTFAPLSQCIGCRNYLWRLKGPKPDPIKKSSLEIESTLEWDNQICLVTNCSLF